MLYNPKVSILIPCYNSEAFIANTLKSAIGQRYSNIEIIIVDDGSTDESVSIIENYLGPNVKLFRQLNKGACAARNLAFQQSNGDLIQYLDADDILTENKIEDQVDLLRSAKPGSLASCKWFKFRGDIQNSEENDLFIYKSYSTPLELLLEMWLERSMMQTSVWLVPRDIVAKAGPWNENLKINQDGEFFCRVILESKYICFASDSIVYYRTGISGSISRSAGNREKALSLLESFILYEKHLQQRVDNNTNVKKALASNFYAFLYIYYHIYPDLCKIALNHIRCLGNRPFYYNYGGKVFSKLAPIFGFMNLLRLRRIKYSLLGG